MRWWMGAWALVGCGAVEPVAFTPHADIVRDPVLSAPSTSQVPPPTPFRDPGDAPDVTVYGYWPYWGDGLDSLYWDQLTHVALFDVTLQADGTLGTTQHWTDHAAEAMALAAPYGVRVHLCVTSFSNSVMGAVLPSPARRATAVAALANLVQAYGAHGVNVDFEGMDAAYRDDLTAFLAELDAAVEDVVVALPAVDWSDAYDEAAMVPHTTALFIMGYNYHWSTGNPGPVAPLYGGGVWSSISLDRSLQDLRATGVPDSAIVLGMPLYGYDWPATNTSVPGVATGSGTARLYASAVAMGASAGRHYDVQTETAYAFPTSTRQLWYDDAQAVEAKVAYGVGEALQGVGFWALTYDDADPDLWSRIDALTHDAEVCGDGVVTAPEVCDDGNLVPGDGCSPSCHVEALTLVDMVPGQAGQTNTLSTTGSAPGTTTWFLATRAPGTLAVPGCPGVYVPLQAPFVVGGGVANGQGQATREVAAPASVAGQVWAFQAVELESCRTSNIVVRRL